MLFQELSNMALLTLPLDLVLFWPLTDLSSPWMLLPTLAMLLIRSSTSRLLMDTQLREMVQPMTLLL